MATSRSLPRTPSTASDRYAAMHDELAACWDERPEVLRLLMKTASYLVNTRHTGQAIALLGSGADIYRDYKCHRIMTKALNALGHSLIEDATPFDHRGEVLLRSLMLTNAEEAFRLAYLENERHPEPDDLIAAESIFKSGVCVRKRLNYGEAAFLFERALGIRSRIPEGNPVEIAHILIYLGVCKHELGCLEDAEGCHVRALRIFTNVYGSEHPDVYSTLLLLACIHRNQDGRCLEATRGHWHRQVIDAIQATCASLECAYSDTISGTLTLAGFRSSRNATILSRFWQKGSRTDRPTSATASATTTTTVTAAAKHGCTAPAAYTNAGGSNYGISTSRNTDKRRHNTSSRNWGSCSIINNYHSNDSRSFSSKEWRSTTTFNSNVSNKLSLNINDWSSWSSSSSDCSSSSSSDCDGSNSKDWSSITSNSRSSKSDDWSSRRIRSISSIGTSMRSASSGRNSADSGNSCCTMDENRSVRNRSRSSTMYDWFVPEIRIRIASPTGSDDDDDDNDADSTKYVTIKLPGNFTDKKPIEPQQTQAPSKNDRKSRNTTMEGLRSLANRVRGFFRVRRRK